MSNTEPKSTEGYLDQASGQWITRQISREESIAELKRELEQFSPKPFELPSRKQTRTLLLHSLEQLGEDISLICPRPDR